MQGTPFGRYRLLDLLGRGGMGEVWRAYDTGTDRLVALKLLPTQLASDATFEQRFRREAHSAARLHNAHIVPIHDYGEINGHFFVDMALIDGHDLATEITVNVLPPERAVTIVEQIAQALSAAHKTGLVHRDVKPANILLNQDGTAYLIDFGIARAAADIGLTGTGNTLGTWAYMAPERFTSDTLDLRSDVYALTCVLYEAITGCKPFPGDTLERQFTGHLHTPPPRPSTGRPELAAFDDVITVGLAKDPERRHPTATSLATAARKALDSTAAANTHLAPTPALVLAAPNAATQAAPTPESATHVAPPARSDVAPAKIRARKHWIPPAAAVAAIAALAIIVVMGIVRITADDTVRITADDSEPAAQIPSVAPPDPTLANSRVVAASQMSVVKVRGVSTSCQRILESTGFVIAPHRVMSSARAVAGTDSTTVNSLGTEYEATVISYDPSADISILAVPDLPSAPLEFNEDHAFPKADAISLGYPGGSFQGEPARVAEVVMLVGPDIYRTKKVEREAYSFRGGVYPGNSGGPLIDVAGRVLGVVLGQPAEAYARELAADGVAFALTAREVRQQRDRAANSERVATGSCADLS